MKPKIILLAFVIAIIASFFYFDLQQYFDLEYLKLQQTALGDAVENYPFAAPAAYFVIYLIVAGFALPAAAILTLAGGALFGFWYGMILVSFASSLGATIAFLITRYLLTETVERKFGERLATVNRGIDEDGAFYVFGLRLVPLFPFFVVNSVLALTRLKTTTFYWASQLGMLAGTAVYVYAGTQLAAIKSTADILSPQLLFAFILLGLFPIVARHALKWLKQQKRGTP